MPINGKKVVCSRGHKFYKSSDCPVCPKCWSGFYRAKKQSDFPASLSAPALRALLNAKIKKVSQLAKFTEAELLKLHGMGPASLPQLKLALRKQNLSFKKTSTTKTGSGPRIVHHNDGSLWAKGSMKQGKMSGLWRWYRKDGTLMRKGRLIAGQQVGEWITYDKHGKVVKVTMMRQK